MKKILGLKLAANLALFIMLISGLVFTIGFGTCLYLARQEVDIETDLTSTLFNPHIPTLIKNQSVMIF